MAISRLSSRLPAGRKTVWVSRLLFDGGKELPFAMIGVPRREIEEYGGGSYELIADAGSGSLWLSAPPQEVATWASNMAGQASVIDGGEPPPGWTRFEGRILRSVEELEAVADGPPPP
jgi:hypothetical protein